MASKKFKPAQPRRILPEETYTSTLSHIISRDYYPSLPSLRRDEAVLRARSAGDVAGAVAIRREARREEERRARERREELAEDGSDVERGGESAAAAASGAPTTRKRARPLRHESLTGFHLRVTSEDNAEFESIQDRERRRREVALGVIYSASADEAGRLRIESCLNEEPMRGVEEEKIKRVGCETPLGLASDLYDASPSAGLRITDGGKKSPTYGIGRNGLFFQPQHRDGSEARMQAGNLMLEASTAAVSSTGTFLSLTNGDSTNDNLLMPPPPARSGAGSLRLTTSEDAKTTSQSAPNTSQLVEYQPKPLIPHINPPATRFPHQAESRLLFNRTPNARRAPLGTDGDTSDATTDLDELPPPLEAERAARREAAMRECETFVPMTPLIRPGGGGAEEPIMTWGTVASTPLVLGAAAVDGANGASADWEPARPSYSNGAGNDDGRPAFDVAEENDREKLARRAEKKLSDRSKSYKSAGSEALSRKADNSAGPDDASVASRVSSRSTDAAAAFDRTASLTPAARALFEANSKAGARRSDSRGGSKTSSRIFQPSPVSSLHAGSRSSFGSALRNAYTPGSASMSERKKRSGRGGGSVSSSSMLRRAAEGGTPRCQLR